MKNQTLIALVILTIISFCPASSVYGLDKSQAKSTNVEAPEVFQPNERNRKTLFNEVINIHWRKKRESPSSSELPSYCLTLGSVCPNTPTSVPKVICLLKCIYNSFPTLQPIRSVLPYVGQLLCQGANTIFSALPRAVTKTPSKFHMLNSLVNYFRVSSNEIPEFAKSGAAALPLTLIKNMEGQDVDELKVLIQNYEIHDSNDKLGQTGGGLTAVANVGGGRFSNKNCQKSNLDGDTLTLASILTKRRCLSDILLPGYFVFSRAPKVASTKRISPILRAWNMPLFLFTGVTCCLIPFADEKKKYECATPLELFDKPHGLGERSGFIPARRVCGSIPDFIEQIISQRTEGEGPTAAPPCSTGGSDNCAEDVTIRAADYSAEATTVVPGQEVDTADEDYSKET